MLAIIMAIECEEDRAYVEELYLRYGKKMSYIANRVLHNDEDAEDCVHDVIKNIIDNIERFQAADELGVKKLLTICTRNTAINQYNRNKRRGAASLNYMMDEENESVELDICDMDANVVELVIGDENAEYVHRLVDKLDVPHRDVIKLKFFHHFRTHEIAKFLGISESLVRMRITRAKRKLLELGGEELYEYR